MKQPVTTVKDSELLSLAGNDMKTTPVYNDISQCNSASYKIAFQDTDLILKDELRPVRLQLELLKTELELTKQNIKSTIGIFGSARLMNPKTAKTRFDFINKQVGKKPDSSDLQKQYKVAKKNLENSRYYTEARELARLISINTKEFECVVMTGGGDGIMEAANRGAFDVDAKSIGLNIVLPFEQIPNKYITPELCFQFHYFAIRKMHFLMRAKALVVFPGGFGTLDEFFEALTLIQTKKIKKIPLILFGKKFWHRLVNFDCLVEEGTISPDDLKLFQFVSNAHEAWNIIKTSCSNSTQI